jgi:hypothetical protein
MADAAVTNIIGSLTQLATDARLKELLEIVKDAEQLGYTDELLCACKPVYEAQHAGDVQAETGS